MVQLVRHGSPVRAVFELLGTNENDLTAALGFTLARSPGLLSAIVHRVWPAATDDDVQRANLALETHGDGGRTDLEILLPDHLIIVEAKRDWLLPGAEQLAAYAPSVRSRGAGLLVSLSQASPALASAILPPDVDGVPANDESLELVAVAGTANEAKGDAGPAQWMPPNRSDWCAYDARFVTVLARYRLPITAADKQAAVRVLSHC